MTYLVNSVSLHLNYVPVAIFDDHPPPSSLSSVLLLVATCPYYHQLRCLPGIRETSMTVCG
jgi:hypothetical protein